MNEFTARKTPAWGKNLLLASYQLYKATIKQPKQI